MFMRAVPTTPLESAQVEQRLRVLSGVRTPLLLGVGESSTTWGEAASCVCLFVLPSEPLLSELVRRSCRSLAVGCGRVCAGGVGFLASPPPGGSPPGVFVKNRKRSPGVLCFPPGRSDFRKIQDLVDLPCISSVDLTYTVNNTSAAEYVSHTRVAELCGRCRQPL